jgi:hypothetical protein
MESVVSTNGRDGYIMGCNCGRGARRAPARVNKIVNKDKGVMGQYKYLTKKQINARLEIYKRRFCKDCENRYKCDFNMYNECKKK